MLKEFRSFLFRGNLLDLATAVILGTAFGAVVKSLVEDLLTPLIAAIGGEPDFSELVLHVGDGKVAYGNFLNALINFVIIAAVIFLLLKAATRAMAATARSGEVAEEVSPPTDEAVLLAEIRDLLKSAAPQ